MTAPEPNRGGPSNGFRILLAGTGGQGVLLAARLLTDFFVRRGHAVVSAQLHGMAQRGGAVQATVMVDTGPSPALRRGDADFLVGLEPVETARALPFVSGKTIVHMNIAPVIPYVLSQQYVLGDTEAKYPDLGRLEACLRSATPHVFPVEGTALAEQAGSVKTLNMVMVGCLVGSGRLPCTPDDFLNTVVKRAPSRLAETNQRAFLSGVEAGRATALIEES
jgi:indolepyruvate ferredoxin oxidoreductase beta subunit